eukprot:g78199.t1
MKTPTFTWETNTEHEKGKARNSPSAAGPLVQCIACRELAPTKPWDTSPLQIRKRKAKVRVWLKSTQVGSSRMSKPEFVENVSRRKWDLEKFASQARMGLEAEAEEDDDHDIKKRGAVVVRKPLQRREYELDLWSKVGKLDVITNATPLNKRGGFYCDVCECLLKDSATYLDHINGRKHQKALGMNMRPERATVSDVRKRLAMHKRKKMEKKRGRDELEERYEQAKQSLKHRKKDGDEVEEKEDGDEAADPAASKSTEVEDGDEEVEDDLDGQGPSSTEDSSSSDASSSSSEPLSSSTSKPTKDSRPAKADSSAETLEDGMDPEFAKLMGFGSFGGSKKNQ